MSKKNRTAADRIREALVALHGDIAKGDVLVSRYYSAQTGRFGWHAVWRCNGAVEYLGRTEAESRGYLAEYLADR